MQSAHASSLFDAFYSLNQPSLKQESRIEHSRVLLGKMGGAVDEAKWSSVSSSRVVSLPGLSMFLMAQMFLERPPKASVGEGNPETILTFVKQHLHDFVSSSTVTKPGRVTLNDVQELQLLLREVANGVEQPFGTSLGFLWTRTEKTIDVAVLTQFLRPRIVLPADIRAQGFPNNVVTEKTIDVAVLTQFLRPRIVLPADIRAQGFPNNVVTKGIVSSVHIQPNPMNAGPANSGTTSSKFPSATFRIAKSAHDVQELQLLLREVANGVEQPFGTSLGFLWTRTEKTIDVAVLTQFLRPRIVLPADIRAQGFPNNVVTKGIVSSVHIQPNPMNAGPANSGTTSSKFPSATFRIAKSAQSSFYVTAELPSTTLSQLSNCSVALGPVAGVLSIDRCENTTISALCGAVVLSNCRNVTLCICTNTPPVLGDGILSNEDVRIAPYNTHYSTLEEHLLSSGINPKLNLWRCGIANPFQLPPAEFSSVSFPIAPQGQAVVTTRTNPVPLPKAYSDALAARVLRFQQVSSMLQQTYRQLETSGRKDLSEGLRQKVHSMFLDYLYDNGQAKSLVDLLHQNAPTATSVPR
ncbi:Hypothetical protein, putative [Bodo saltans]|uniref:C-CAP/cofactor C-like domain-containing protein n=1 Tax=Bodo saltans TaxID=75058 RepID=A0A0S4IVF7_BODSA|nr:Hypothetical protein, putative [Bodo saltans]|eukprot:CUG03839.1 Hypothetical protein, putative [Bodo saltans]